MSIGLYFETWSSTWTSDPTNLSLQMTAGQPVTIVNIAFAQPDMQYSSGSFAGTGLEFSQDFAVVKSAIALLISKGVRVMLSVGGGSYWSVPKTFNARGCVALMRDLGCTGIDVDWEVGVSDSSALASAIANLHAEGCPRISFAGFSTGAYGAEKGDTYKGMSIEAMMNVGGLVDWINIMTYDAGSSFDPLGAFTCYRMYYKGVLNLGFEPGKQSWGDKVIGMNDVTAMCNWVKKDGNLNGVFIWSNKKDTTGSPSLGDIVAESARIIINSTSSSPQVVDIPIPPTTSPVPMPCPNCGKSLKIVLA